MSFSDSPCNIVTYSTVGYIMTFGFLGVPHLILSRLLEVSSFVFVLVLRKWENL